MALWRGKVMVGIRKMVMITNRIAEIMLSGCVDSFGGRSSEGFGRVLVCNGCRVLSWRMVRLKTLSTTT